MPEIHLIQHGFTCSACGTFTKNKERIQKSRETEGSRYLYQNELDKACFQHACCYRDFKDLTGRTPSDKIMRDKAFNFPKNQKCDEYQPGLASMIYKFFDKKRLVVI